MNRLKNLRILDFRKETAFNVFLEGEREVECYLFYDIKCRWNTNLHIMEVNTIFFRLF